MVITGRQLEILQHARGVDRYGRGQRYRNHFAAGEADVADCRELVAAGYMREHKSPDWLPYPLFTVTEDGDQYISDESPAAPKLSRSAQRYRRYLSSDSGLSFGDWLRQQ